MVQIPQLKLEVLQSFLVEILHHHTNTHAHPREESFSAAQVGKENATIQKAPKTSKSQ
jgi:hypothetical protein